MTAAPRVEMKSLRGLADLVMLGVHGLMAWPTVTTTSRQLMGAMVLDRLNAEAFSTQAEFPNRWSTPCQRGGFCQRTESLRSHALE